MGFLDLPVVQSAARAIGQDAASRTLRDGLAMTNDNLTSALWNAQGARDAVVHDILGYDKNGVPPALKQSWQELGPAGIAAPNESADLVDGFQYGGSALSSAMSGPPSILSLDPVAPAPRAEYGRRMLQGYVRPIASALADAHTGATMLGDDRRLVEPLIQQARFVVRQLEDMVVGGQDPTKAEIELVLTTIQQAHDTAAGIRMN